MDESLNEIASQIQNDMGQGLKTPQNLSISLDQIKDQFGQERAQAAQELLSSGRLDREPFMQSINKLPVAKREFSGAGIPSGRQEFAADIAELLYVSGLDPIGYISTMSKTFPWKVISGQDVMFMKHSVSAKQPTVWIQDKVLWLLNSPIANITNISFRAILSNPRALNGLPGQMFMDDDPYPCPPDVVAAIRKKMVDQYVRQYRTGNPQPTIQAGDLNITSLPNGQPQTKSR